MESRLNLRDSEEERGREGGERRGRGLNGGRDGEKTERERDRLEEIRRERLVESGRLGGTHREERLGG